MKFKFNVGDKVKYVGIIDKNVLSDRAITLISNPLTIEKRISVLDTPCYYVSEDDTFIIKQDDLELIEEAESVKLKYTKPTKVELFNMPLGTRIFTDAKGINGEDNAFIFDGKDFDSPHFRIPPTIISDELKIIYNDFPDVSPIVGTHIIKIEVPTDYETVYEEETMESLRKLNEELTRQITELKKKLYEKNSQDINISRQEIDIMNDFFERR